MEVLNSNCNVQIGDKTLINENVVFGNKCKNIIIGYGCFIGRDVYIDVEELIIGDYTTIHHGSVLSGIKTSIGHNCWFGHYTIIDSLGGFTSIGNNVGVGAHSQLWSHMKFGDVLAGCRWNSSGKLVLEDDVWLVGHSITGPVVAREKSMLLTGGVLLGNMEKNSIYQGSPAINVTDKYGGQFREKGRDKVLNGFARLLDNFKLQTGADTSTIKVVEKFDLDNDDVTQFMPYERLYKPIRSEAEHLFIKFCLYDKAKFIPVFTNDYIQQTAFNRQ